MKNNMATLANIERLHFVADKLGDLRSEVVFLGGCTTALFVTDPASPDVRYTLDVDCIVDVISLTQYYQLEDKLIARGFKKSVQDSVICRWHYNDVILDVMPTEKSILGFSNRWYSDAIQHSVNYALSTVLNVKLVTAPYFLATKFEAFIGRGGNDYLSSHDFEDIISVLDGRFEIIDEIQNSDDKLKKYLTHKFNEIKNSRAFQDALPGHFVHYGVLSDERIELLLGKIDLIVNL